MRTVDKPWGYELIWAETSKYVGKILHINDGASLSLQYHKVKEETIMVQSGILTLEIGSDDDSRTIIKLPDGHIHHIPPGMIHKMSALDGPVDVIEVSSPELDDVVRLSDNYGRV